jgi:hypothetical protein
MKKPDKKTTPRDPCLLYYNPSTNSYEEILTDFDRGYNKSSNDWMGCLKELIEDLKRVNHHTIKEELWRLEELIK